MPLSRRRLLTGISACSLLTLCPFIVRTALSATPQSSLLTLFGKLPENRPVRYVLSAGPVADMLLLALAVEKLAGFAWLDLHNAPDFVTTPAIRQMPILGRLTGRSNTLSLEQIIALNPDLIIDTGEVNETYRSLAQRVFSQTQIPYLLVDGQLADTPLQLQQVSEVLDAHHTGSKNRSQPLTALAERFISDAQHFAARATQPVRFYSARGSRGLETGLQGSLHTETIELLGLHNVAQVPGRSGLTSVSMEQLLLWQPDIIITQDINVWQLIRHDPLWRGVKAAQQGNVLLFRRFPFGWLDSPPGINRLLGLRRLHAHFDPAIRASLIDDARAFFRLFLHSDISASQWRQLLADPA